MKKSWLVFFFLKKKPPLLVVRRLTLYFQGIFQGMLTSLTRTKEVFPKKVSPLIYSFYKVPTYQILCFWNIKHLSYRGGNIGSVVNLLDTNKRGFSDFFLHCWDIHFIGYLPTKFQVSWTSNTWVSGGGSYAAPPPGIRVSQHPLGIGLIDEAYSNGDL